MLTQPFCGSDTSPLFSPRKYHYMYVLITYDVSTESKAGRRRLRNTAKTCLDFGQRVQNSVFECKVDPAQWANLRKLLLDIIDTDEDSIRFYFLGKNYQNKIEHHGQKPTTDFDDPLII